MNETVTIRDNTYPKPHIDRMKRKQAKALKPLLKKIQSEDLEALWEVVGVMLPDLPRSVLDDLTIGECKEILTVSGVAQFDSAPQNASEITVGEYSASTSS